MSSDVSRAGIQALKGKQPPIPRAVDLYGCGIDGRPMLWQHAEQVLPVTTFERNGRWIKNGHYVNQHNGDAVVVHCANMLNENVSVEFMHTELTPRILPRAVIGSMLLGKIMILEEQQAAVFERR